MGKQGKQCQTLFLEGSKITANGDCSQEIKRRLLLGRKVMTNLDSIGWFRVGNSCTPVVDSCQCMAKPIQYCKVKKKKKSRDITLPTKVRLVKAMVFPVVVYGCESWTVKKAKHQRIDAFEL